MTITQWHGDTVVVDVSGIDGTKLVTRDGIGKMSWNAWANAHNGTHPDRIYETGYRYEDNWVITNGEPVSCAAIGFAY